MHLDAIMLVHLPSRPTAYFELTSIELSKQIHVGFIIFGHTVSDNQLGPRKSFSSQPRTRPKRICDKARSYSRKNVPNPVSSTSSIRRTTGCDTTQSETSCSSDDIGFITGFITSISSLLHTNGTSDTHLGLQRRLRCRRLVLASL